MIRLEIAGQSHRAQAVPDLFAPAAELLLDAISELSSGARVLCLEPGSPLLIHAAVAHEALTQAQLLSVAKRPDNGLAATVQGRATLIQGDNMFMPLATGSCDAVLGNLVLGDSGLDMVQLREMVRVLKPGGQLVATALVSGTLQEFYDTTRAVCERLSLHGSRAVLAGERAGQYDLERLRKVCVACGIKDPELGVEQRAWLFDSGHAFIGDTMVQSVFISDWLRTLPDPKIRANTLNSVGEDLVRDSADGAFVTQLVTAVISGVKK